MLSNPNKLTYAERLESRTIAERQLIEAYERNPDQFSISAFDAECNDRTGREIWSQYDVASCCYY